LLVVVGSIGATKEEKTEAVEETEAAGRTEAARGTEDAGETEDAGRTELIEEKKREESVGILETGFGTGIGVTNGRIRTTRLGRTGTQGILTRGREFKLA
jgi:hypothetical protein